MAKALTLTKDNIVKSAVKLINSEGWESLNARSLAKHIGISTKPLYRIYGSMDEIKSDVLAEIYHQYDEFINSKIDSKKALITLCIAYVEFANDYKNLFVSLFLSDNLKWKKIEDVFDEKWNQSTIINLVNKHSFSFEEAKELFPGLKHGIINSDYSIQDYATYKTLLSECIEKNPEVNEAFKKAGVETHNSEEIFNTYINKQPMLGFGKYYTGLKQYTAEVLGISEKEAGEKLVITDNTRNVLNKINMMVMEQQISKNEPLLQYHITTILKIIKQVL